MNIVMLNDTEKSLQLLIAGMICIGKSKFDKACQCFDQSIRDTDDNEIAWFAKAMAYQKMGKIDEAKGCLKVAMMSFDKGYDIENIEMPPVTEFFSNKITQREEPKLNFII
jgi:tetratricopeptide (TPR) repeat protein